MNECFVLIGVARSRERWFSELARWSNSGVAPIEFVKCLSPDEARAVLGSGRRVSALLLDARGPGLDRELVAMAQDRAVPTFAVSDGSVHRDWDALGCATVLDDDFSPEDLIAELVDHARPVDRRRLHGRATIAPSAPRTSSRLIGVLGSGGVGSSTVAMALAQGLASHDESDSVVLVDGTSRCELAMFHDVGDVIPGLPELVDAHRSDRLDPDEIRRITFEVPARGYRLVLGRRRPADWVTLRHRSVDAALDGLLRSFHTVVADLDADLDGERETGSIDVGDRHAVAIASLRRADLVMVVGRPGIKGIHALASLLVEVISAGVPANRVVPVVNDSPRSPVTRSQIDRAIERLALPAGPDAARAARPAPVHLRHQRHLEDLHERCSALPEALTSPLCGSTTRLLRQLDPRPLDHEPALDRVRPGELGTDADVAHDTAPGLRSDVA